MSPFTKLIIFTATLFNLLAITSIFNGQTFRGLLLQRDRVFDLGDQERKLYADINNANAFDDTEKFEKFIEERSKLLTEEEKAIVKYGELLKKSNSLLLSKSYKEFLKLDQEFYKFQKDNHLISKESRVLADQNTNLYLKFAKAYKRANLIFDKTEKNDFSNLPEMRNQMKQITDEVKQVATQAKQFEGKSLVSEDVEYYQKYADFYQAWSDYLQYYNTGNLAKQNEAANKTVAFNNWLDKKTDYVANQKSYETFIQPFDKKLEENRKAGEEVLRQEKRYTKGAPFFFHF